jgi:hypothetical protein
MKTGKIKNTMKSMNLNQTMLVITFLFFAMNQAKPQFIGSNMDSSMIAQDARKGSIVEYSLKSDAQPGDEYRWEIVGGKIINPGAVGEGTSANPSVIEFTINMHTIEVQWATDDSNSTVYPGIIMVQKKSRGYCASDINKLRVNLWSMPTASVSGAYPGFTICSGETVGGNVVVNLTGSANFTFKYSIKSNGLKDENGTAINTEFKEITVVNDTARIPLPLRLFNPSEASEKYYTIELMSMNDGFLGDGEVVSGRKEFTIIVSPSVSIGTIESIKLNKR